jgi:hypothetical protein
LERTRAVLEIASPVSGQLVQLRNVSLRLPLTLTSGSDSELELSGSSLIILRFPTDSLDNNCLNNNGERCVFLSPVMLEEPECINTMVDVFRLYYVTALKVTRTG